jgi:hypothetical protein
MIKMLLINGVHCWTSVLDGNIGATDALIFLKTEAPPEYLLCGFRLKKDASTQSII